MSATIDFMRKPTRQPPIGWLILAIGASALVAALVFEQDVAADQAKADAIARAEGEAERLRRQPARVKAPTARELRQQQAQAELHRPWLQTLRVIEATAQAPVFLRSLAIEPSAGVVKLEAEAPTFDQALAYAQSLNEDHLLGPALLTSHERAVDPTTHTDVVRFSVATPWNVR